MIQTFVIEENKELLYDNDKLQEWKEKCNALGLDKQLELVTKEASPIPFEHMNTVSKRVYETLCPAKVNYKQYNKTAIPIEVLGLIQLSINENYFKEVQIWYDDKAPDPLVVGIKQRTVEWDNDFYLIARWGDVLKSFSELKAEAITRYMESSRISLQRKLSDCRIKLETLTENTAAYFDAQIEQYDIIGF